MAFERDFVLRFQDDGRNALINYHKGLKETHLKMVPLVNEFIGTGRPGDQRFAQHFTTLAQREEHNLMCLIGPPDRTDHEMVSVPPHVAAMLYGAYAEFNAARCEQLRPNAPPELVAHLEKVTHLLEKLALAAEAATAKVPFPSAMMNLGFDTVLAEIDPSSYEAAMAHA